MTTQNKTSVKANSLGHISLEPKYIQRPRCRGQANSLGLMQENDYSTSSKAVGAGKANSLGIFVMHKRRRVSSTSNTDVQPQGLKKQAAGVAKAAAGVPTQFGFPAPASSQQQAPTRLTFDHMDGAAYEAHGPNSAAARSAFRATRGRRAAAAALPAEADVALSDATHAITEDVAHIDA